MEEIDPRHLLVKIGELLNKSKIPYFVTGGMAVFAWGRPRFTADIDIVIQLRLADVRRLVSSLEALSRVNYLDLGYIRKWAKAQSTLKVFEELCKKKKA